MTIERGTRLGPYEILAPLGAGGMGEVWRARDTRLGRDVAVKVLPHHLSANAEVRVRFEREAKTVSALNHPHICTLFDVGREGDNDYLVMELIEGETLAARLAKGPLPAAEVLRVGAELADALDRAHRAGVVHRDLKPGNVMFTRSGAKLMDFGLARATGAAPSGNGSVATAVALAQSPTVAQPLTAEGTIVGTFQYMAPEQLEGREADSRADLWSLGCVLYEMATGRRAFAGATHASLISAIMRDTPRPMAELAPLSPPALERLVTALLAKDPDDRIQTAHDAMLQLRWAAEGTSVAGAPAAVAAPARSRRLPLPWFVAAASLLVAGGALWLGPRVRPPIRPAGVQAAVLPPAGVVYSSSTDRPMPLAVSPDGRTIVFCARNGEGPDMLWVRSVGASDARLIAGTQGAQGPFFSPDGKAIGFFAQGKMKRVGAGGGAVITLADRVDPRGGSWSPRGEIVFGNTAYGPLWKVKEDGGPVIAATALDTTRGEATHRYPWFLPDGRHFLYLARQSGAGAGETPTIYVGDLDSPRRTRVLEVASNVAYASGYLLYIREGVLVAQRFDPRTFAVSGSALPLVDDARMDERFSRGVFSVSTGGVLACMTGRNQTRTQLQWLGRDGKWLADVGEPADYTYGGTPELSPDGGQSVMPIANRDRGTSDVWIVDLGSGRRRRLTVDADDHPAVVWLPGAKRVVVSTSHVADKTFTMEDLAVEGAMRRALPIQGGLYLWPRSVSPDGSTLLYDAPEGSFRESTDIWTLPLAGAGAPVLVAGGDGSQSHAVFSPDGRSFAYESVESGRTEVYVAAYPAGGRWQVSQDGGSEPRWRRDGRELFYVDAENFLVVVEVRAGVAGFDAGSATRLFQFHGAGGQWRYDVNQDGTRFLVTRALNEDLASPVTLITDWTRKVEGS